MPWFFDVEQVFASIINVEIQLTTFYICWCFKLNERKFSLFWKFRCSIQKHSLEALEELSKLFNLIKVPNGRIWLKMAPIFSPFPLINLINSQVKNFGYSDNSIYILFLTTEKIVSIPKYIFSWQYILDVFIFSIKPAYIKGVRIIMLYSFKTFSYPSDCSVHTMK